MSNGAMLAKYETDNGQEIELDAQTVREICGGGNQNITDREVRNFIELCKAHRLNPFIREAYLAKYGTAPATILAGKDVFTKRAQRNPDCRGFRAGVIVCTAAGSMVEREGSAVFEGEYIQGGWAEVFMDGYVVPIKDTVAFNEYSTGKSNWKKMPGTMIRKVALVHALREAMPEDFGGLYDSSEMEQAHYGSEAEPQPVYEVTVEDASTKPETAPQAEPERLPEAPKAEAEVIEAEAVTFPDGSAERSEQEHRLHDLFVLGKETGFDLKAFHAYARATYGREYIEFTTDQLKSCGDELERRLKRHESEKEAKHVWQQ